MTNPKNCRRATQVATLLLMALICVAASFASSGKTVHSFASLANGANPQANVVSDSSGNLYGTTYFGGSHDLGEVYELTPTSDGKFTQTVLYSFAGGTDGSYPWSSLTIDSSGNLYGTTAGGGTGTLCTNNCGTVFKLTKSGDTWTESILYSFIGGASGSEPITGVIFDSSGNLYGTASSAYGYYGSSVVYKLSPSSPTWTETVLYTFSNSTGYFPITTPVFDTAGNLYGTAVSYATYQGIVYKLSAGSWTETTIQTFNGGSLTPLIFDSTGNLYGTTEDSGVCNTGDIAFELSPSTGATWTEKTLYCFGANNDGQINEGRIAFDSAGNLYGTTFEGGSLGFGTVYQLVPKSSGFWTEHIIKNFTDGSDGSQPTGGVTFDPSGYLYATSYAGDSGACLYSNYGNGGCGAVIRLTPKSDGPWPSTTISHFSGTDAAVPMGGLVADSSGNYYGTGAGGGAYGSGEVFRLSPNKNGTWTKTVLYDFTGSNGKGDGLYPSGNLIFDKAGNLYGTTAMGGNTDYCSNYWAGCGIAYELSPTKSGPWTEKILATFSAAVGGYPVAGLTFDKAGNLYGTTEQGGPGGCYLIASGCGSVFELTPVSGGAWTLNTLYQFTGNNDGGNPNGSVAIDSAGNLYGTTYTAGANQVGTAFELSPGSGGTWTFNVIHTYGATGDAQYPTSGFTLDSAGNLYGTGYGPSGSLGGGVVYELSLAAGTWNTTILHVFTDKPDGSSPWGGVIFDSAGNLYGTTSQGGKSLNCQNGCGTIYSMSPSASGWNEMVLYSFTGAGDGSAPLSSVILDSAGDVFTTASAGGGGHQGTVFEVIK